MKYKIKTNGTISGTQIFDEKNNLIGDVSEITFVTDVSTDINYYQKFIENVRNTLKPKQLSLFENDE